MLYDCRNDQLVPGVTLWNKTDLEKDVGIHPQPLTEYLLETSNSLTDKAKALDINSSLRGSFACGLVKVEGSAKYLNNSNSSKHQVRVTLNYFMTTMFKQLTMSQLSRNNITYEEVFRQGTATHVVTAILYGARALLVFDRDISKDESVQTIAGHLKVSVNKIPHFTIKGKGAVDFCDKEKEELEKIRCTFHGDVRIPNLPVDYLTALDVYKTLPALLGKDGEHAVPITVWLYPLSLLEPVAAKLMNEISIHLVTQVERVLDSLLEADMMCNDLLTDFTVKCFYSIEQKVIRFKTLLGDYKLHFQKNLAEIIPSIRGGTAAETALADFLETHGMSPFSQPKLQGWLSSLQKEIQVIETLVKDMKNGNVSLLTGKMDITENLLLESNVNYIISFNFNRLSSEGKILNTMENYVKCRKLKNDRDKDMESNEGNGDEWIYSQMGFNKIRERKTLFVDFVVNNLQNKAIKFMVTAQPMEKRECISILLYRNGELCNPDFEPPSIPDVPKVVKAFSDFAEIKLSLPLHGSKETMKYLVQVRKENEKEWSSQVTDNTENCFILKDLQKSTRYEVRYAAVCEAGVGPPSGVILLHTEDSGLVTCCCEKLQDLDLSNTTITPECMRTLALTVHAFKYVRMTCCGLTSRCCENLSLVLSAEHSHLTELYLNNNNLEDSGVHLLCEGLRNQKCQLQKLRLINCGLTSGSCETLSSVLSGEYSQLTELDLGNNKLDNSGVNLLCKGWNTCKLLKLGLWSCGLTSGCCVALSSALSAEHSRLTQLELNDNNLQDSGVRLLCEGLRNRNCKLEKLGLNSCGLTSGCCGALSSVLSDEHSRLTELWLGGNNLEDSGVDQICDGLRSPNCKLEKLGLFRCSLTSGCCSALSAALSAEHSCLTYLELRYNNLKNTGVQLLCKGLRNVNCKLDRLGLLSCHLTHECCEALSSVLSDEHSCLTKLELGQNNLGDSGVHLLCEPLKSTNCKLEKLRVHHTGLSNEGTKHLKSLEKELNKSGWRVTIYL
ncbi:cytolytic toxin-beta-like [Polypterus senegalus]|uniref:cytolytic toxin-beta-like n=1 Tax=Polypterus senegalus TaxID=55291 RepID=UPI0019632BC5|nr:cytolytic toxin-beta-like [Polypterus senegalus]XP_039617939.1 cytolytic toxin-beta-like [Polypterus senegalus]